MPVKQRNPRTPGQRLQILDTYEDITTNVPEKSLITRLNQKAGRDWRGRVSMRHRGGGNKKFYRMIDFKRNKDNIPAEVMTIEYDPNRNVRIALVKYTDGEKKYILAPLGLKVGDTVSSGPNADIKLGNAMQLKDMPVGTVIHNVELRKDGGGQLARAAGAAIQLVAKEGKYAIVKLPSGEQRLVHIECRATIGQLGNIDAKNVILGKAGKKRFLGRRPEVRGVAMNPCDHPHGGGEGKAGIGKKHPVSPWGQPALGYKTRRRKQGSRFILIRRK